MGKENTLYLANSFRASYKALCSQKRIDPTQVWNFEQLKILKEMAENDIWPDNTFGDLDCEVWSLFRN